MKILFLTTVYPGHGRTGGDLASQCYIDGLRATGAEVHTLSFLRPHDAAPHHPQDFIAEVRAIETAESGLRAALWLGLSLLRGTPYSAEKYRSDAYSRRVRSLCQENDYAFCVLDHASRLGWVLPQLPRTLKVVANTHNIEHQIYQRLRDAATSPLRRLLYAREARRVRAVELGLPARVSEIWTLSEEDGAAYRAFAGAERVRWFSTPPAPMHPPDPLPERSCDIGLLGNWQWVSNREGLDWFAQTCLPKLPSTLRIEIAGKGAEHLEGAHPGLVVRGFVSSAEAFMCSARVFAIPTVSGGGVQIKSLNAIALGVPVVATSFAVRGIRNPPQTVCIADTPEAFVGALLERVAAPLAPPDAVALAWGRQLREHHAAALAEAVRALVP